MASLLVGPTNCRFHTKCTLLILSQYKHNNLPWNHWVAKRQNDVYLELCRVLYLAIRLLVHKEIPICILLYLSFFLSISRMDKMLPTQAQRKPQRSLSSTRHTSEKFCSASHSTFSLVLIKIGRLLPILHSYLQQEHYNKKVLPGPWRGSAGLAINYLHATATESQASGIYSALPQ